MGGSAGLHGLLLAGGQSRRMGVDKAGLKVAGSTQLERAYRMLSEVAAPVFVSIRGAQRDEPLRSRYPVLVDDPSVEGPAAGLLAAHAYAPDAPWLVLAVDMPLVTSALLAELVAGRDAQADATAWRAVADARPEPLCAIYEAATLARFAALGEAAPRSPRHWLESSRVKYLAGGSSDMLRGANTPEEFKHLVQAASATREQD